MFRSRRFLLHKNPHFLANKAARNPHAIMMPLADHISNPQMSDLQMRMSDRQTHHSTHRVRNQEMLVGASSHNTNKSNGPLSSSGQVQRDIRVRASRDM